MGATAAAATTHAAAAAAASGATAAAAAESTTAVSAAARSSARGATVEEGAEDFLESVVELRGDLRHLEASLVQRLQRTRFQLYFSDPIDRNVFFEVSGGQDIEPTLVLNQNRISFS